jgi:hypothetical protein
MTDDQIESVAGAVLCERSDPTDQGT